MPSVRIFFVFPHSVPRHWNKTAFHFSRLEMRLSSGTTEILLAYSLIQVPAGKTTIHLCLLSNPVSLDEANLTQNSKKSSM